MLLMLLPEQVPQYWEDIREGMNRAVPSDIPDRDQKVLEKLQIGMMQTWISYRRGDKTTVDACIITAIVNDQVHETRNLLVYAIWAIERTVWKSWTEGLEALKKFAKGKGCNRVIGYTKFDMMVKLAKETEGNTEYIFLSWNV